jgi:hypothetical protein
MWAYRTATVGRRWFMFCYVTERNMSDEIRVEKRHKHSII